MNTIKIFLADDHTILREGLKSIITSDERIKIVGEAGDGREALERIEEIKPDLAIIDISMPSLNGIEVSRQVKKYYPQIKILILSQHDNEEFIKELISIGIDGYVLKSNAKDELLRAIDIIINGDKYLSPQVTSRLMSSFNETPQKTQSDFKTRFDLLSNREKEILLLIAEGKTNIEIASQLFITPETVKTHRSSIMKKLGLKNAVEVVRYAIKEGLIEP